MPSIIAISETKLRENNVYNISILGYEFISKPSKTNTGGVELYIKDDIQFIKRPGLEINLDGIETCFIELPRVKQKHVIAGCIYRHRHSDRVDFQENLQQTLESLNNQGYDAYITGDINVDLF